MLGPARGVRSEAHPMRLGRYELLAPLVRGGMGDVWLGRAQGLSGFERLFAIKTIRTDRADDALFRTMFLDEARIAAHVTSDYAVSVFEVGEEDGFLFMVMEWINGDSVSRIVRRADEVGAKLPLHVVLGIVADACRGLQAAHETRNASGEPLGLIHRDVSPQNLLVTDWGITKVIDFGIAKANSRQIQSSVGTLKGKLHYMAPEQALGGAIDRRADVWALGAVLYELLEGHPPFRGDSEAALLAQLMSADVPELRAEVPLAVRRVVMQSLQRDPADRFETAEAMRLAIEAAADECELTLEHGDVAAFLRERLPMLAESRQRLVDEASAVRRTVVGVSGVSPVGSASLDQTALESTKLETPEHRRARERESTPETMLTSDSPAPAAHAPRTTTAASFLVRVAVGAIALAAVVAGTWVVATRRGETVAATTPPPAPITAASEPSPAGSVAATTVSASPPPSRASAAGVESARPPAVPKRGRLEPRAAPSTASGGSPRPLVVPDSRD